jgi:hypothetical protein
MDGYYDGAGFSYDPNEGAYSAYFGNYTEVWHDGNLNLEYNPTYNQYSVERPITQINYDDSGNITDAEFRDVTIWTINEPENPESWNEFFNFLETEQPFPGIGGGWDGTGLSGGPGLPAGYSGGTVTVGDPETVETEAE